MDHLSQPTWASPGAQVSGDRDGDERYLPTELLGEGGMAEVWRVWDRKLGAWAAMKVLRRKYAEQREARRRFMDEAAILIQLDHRNVIHAYDLRDEDPPKLVMEVADGGSLHDWVARHGPMPPRMAVGIAVQICKGLGAAHRENVIHRDVKPHNVLVNRKGVCKLSDFGIARIPRRDGSHDVPDATTAQTSHDPMGTLGYMAPEQRSNPKAADFRADIYGVGAALFHLLIGGPNPYLFAADKNPEVLREIPGPLRPVLLKAVSYRPEDRYAEIRELSLALYYVREELPEDPPGTPQLAEGLPPEPPPPAGMTPTHSGSERIDEHDIEVPTTIPRMNQQQRGRRAPPPASPPRSAAAEPSHDPPSTGVPLQRAASIPAAPPPPPNVPNALLPHQGTPSRPSSVRPRIERMIERSMVSGVDLRRPRLIVGTRLWVVALAMVGFVLAGLLADHVWLRTYQMAASRERAEFLAQVQRSRKSLVDLLAQVPGVDPKAVEGQFDGLVDAQGLDQQLRASQELRQTLEEVRPKLAAPNCPACPRARNHVDQLLQEQNQWRRAHRAWLEASTTFPGSMAVRLGLDPMAPPISP